MSTVWEPVIGLEIHVQLATRTKMFCGCEVSFGEPPNTRTCPVCLGLPGALPVANAQAVHFGLMIGLAVSSELAPRSIFHRKNYFYPDLPKGYQISQYDEPLCRGGRLGEVRIHRVHMEEDAAKLTHVGASGRIHGSGASIVDFNRGGTPLVEIVTEPDVRSAEQAGEWLRLLRVTLRALGVSDVNMEEGSLRVDANVSVREASADALGVKTELKNLNSFRFLEQGIRAEIARQQEVLSTGGSVIQETLHFDPSSGAITSMRSKEEAHDYRYFPEPDLLPVAITEEMVQSARVAMPELPSTRAERYERELGLSSERARTLAFRRELGDYFERALEAASGEDGAAAGADADAREPGRGGASPAHRRGGRSGALAGHAGGDPDGVGNGRAQADQHRRGAPGARQPGARGRGPGGDRGARGARGDRRRGRARGGRGERAGGESGGRAAGARRGGQGDRADRRSRDARDQGPRGRRRGHAPGARAARRVSVAGPWAVGPKRR